MHRRTRNPCRQENQRRDHGAPYNGGSLSLGGASCKREVRDDVVRICCWSKYLVHGRREDAMTGEPLAT